MRETPTTIDPGVSKAELGALLGLLRSAGLSGAHLEIGAAGGGTLRELMRVYPGAARPPFVAIDTFDYFLNQRGSVERNLAAGWIDPTTVDLRVGPS